MYDTPPHDDSNDLEYQHPVDASESSHRGASYAAVDLLQKSSTQNTRQPDQVPDSATSDDALMDSYLVDAGPSYDSDAMEQRLDQYASMRIGASNNGSFARGGRPTVAVSIPTSSQAQLPLQQPRLSLIRILLITICFCGIQFGWALQIALLTPFMLELGLPKWATTLVWLCGPLGGLIVQPLVGVLSDRCTSRLGRRRPFILSGTIFIALSLLLIPNSLDIGFLLGDKPQPGKNPIALLLAVVGFWILDFSNNMVQGPCRAVIADLAPPEQQDLGFSLFSAWLALGNILGYLTGFVPFSQLDFLKRFITPACHEGCLNLRICFSISIVLLVLTVFITLIAAKEQRHRPHAKLPTIPPPEEDEIEEAQAHGTTLTNKRIPKSNFIAKIADTSAAHLLRLILGMPLRMRRICLVQFFSWFGWFSFLVYITDWMGENVFHGDPEAPVGSVLYKRYEEGVRWGSFGLAGFALVSLLTSPLAPLMSKYLGHKLTWMIGSICLGVSLGLTLLVGNKWEGVILISTFGLPWSISMTVPFTLVSLVAPEEEKGIYLGILNIFVVLPQLVMAMVGIFLNWAFSGNVAIALALGGLSALLSSLLVPFVILGKPPVLTDPRNSAVLTPPADYRFETESAVNAPPGSTRVAIAPEKAERLPILYSPAISPDPDINRSQV